MSSFGRRPDTTLSFNGPPHIIFGKAEPSEAKRVTHFFSIEKNSKVLFILNPAYKFDVFKYIEKKYTIITKNGSYKFNIEFLKDTSALLGRLIEEDPENLQFQMNFKDEDNLMKKIEQLYNGKKINITDSELYGFKLICDELDINKSLKNMNRSLSIGQAGPRPIQKDTKNSIQIIENYFFSYLKNTFPHTFTIATKNKEYACNNIGINSSNILRAFLSKNPSSNRYEYDFDDENNEFQPICDFFNFKLVTITADNMNSLKTIAEELQIDFILPNINKFIDDYDQRVQTIDDQQSIIDSIEDLFEMLYKIKESTVETVKDHILESTWCETVEDVQELAAFILQVIETDFQLHTYMADLIESLSKEAKESNKLDILVPFIVNHLMHSFGKNKFINSFIYLLSKKGYIQKEDIMLKIKDYAENKITNKSGFGQAVPSGFSKTASTGFGKPVSSGFGNPNQRSATVSELLIFLPEFYEFFESNTEKLLDCFRKSNTNFIQSYFPDKIEDFKKMRDSGEPDDPITKALRSDDVDAFQSIVTKTQVDYSEAVVPFNIFESFVENGETSYINYSAAYGSLKCFKYLLLNHAPLDKLSFTYAAFGGNIEIVKVIDQKSDEIEENNKPKPAQRFGARPAGQAAGGLGQRPPGFGQAAGGLGPRPGFGQAAGGLGPRPGFGQAGANFGANNPQRPAGANFGLNPRPAGQAVGGLGQRPPGFGQAAGGLGQRPPGFGQAAGGLGQRPPGFGQAVGGFGRQIQRVDSKLCLKPAILKHQNDLFDWILEQKFKDINQNRDLLIFILLNASESGNCHSIATLVDKGLDFSIFERDYQIKIIKNAAQNGYCKLLQFILSVLGKYIDQSVNFGFGQNINYFDSVSSVSFGNLSIFKLYNEKSKNMNYEQALNTSIGYDYMNIIEYIFDDILKDKIADKTMKYGFGTTGTFKSRVIQPNGDKIYINFYTLLSKSLQSKDNHIFNYFIKKFETIDPNPLKSMNKVSLLTEACCLNNVELSKKIMDFIDEFKDDDAKLDFTLPFYNAAISNSIELCQFLVDKKVFIDYKLLSLQVMQLSKINFDILNIIFKNMTQDTKDIFNFCYLKEVIKKQNKPFIEYLLKEGAIYDDVLFDAIETGNLEIVDLILKYHNTPSFINQLSERGTALNFAVSLNHLSIVKRLLTIPEIDPSLYENSNITPLITAIMVLNIDMINAILDYYGENIKSQMWQLDEAVKQFLSMISSQKRREQRGLRSSSFGTKSSFGKSPSALSTKERILMEQRIKMRNNNDEQNEDAKYMAVLNRLLEIENIDLNCHSDNYTLFTYACEANEIDIVEMMMKNPKVDVNSYAPMNGNTPLLIAIEKKNTEIIKLLIECDRTNINQRSYSKKTALTVAVQNDLIEIVDIIINHKQFDPVESRLNYAFLISKGEISNKLSKVEALDVNYKMPMVTDNRKTLGPRPVGAMALNARSFGSANITHRPECKNELSLFSTSLIYAVNQNNIEMIDLIINHKTFDLEKSLTKEAIFIACEQDKLEIFQKLFKLYNDDLNLVDKPDRTLIQEAINCDSSDVLNEILNNKTFDSKKNDLLKLFISSLNSRRPMFNIMSTLLDFDNQHDKVIGFDKLLPDGSTFFDIIPINNNLIQQIADFLLEKGVDPNIPNKDGVYPLQRAIQRRNLRLAMSLMNSGKIDFNVKINYNPNALSGIGFSNSFNRPAEGKSYLHFAARTNEIVFLRQFLSNNYIDVNVTDSNGETPLMDACRNLNFNGVNYLFQRDDLDYLHCNNDGDDALKIVLKMTNKKNPYPTDTKANYLKALTQILAEEAKSARKFGRKRDEDSDDENEEEEDNENDDEKKEKEDKEDKDSDEKKVEKKTFGTSKLKAGDEKQQNESEKSGQTPEKKTFGSSKFGQSAEKKAFGSSKFGQTAEKKTFGKSPSSNSVDSSSIQDEVMAAILESIDATPEQVQMISNRLISIADNKAKEIAETLANQKPKNEVPEAKKPQVQLKANEKPTNKTIEDKEQPTNEEVENKEKPVTNPIQQYIEEIDGNKEDEQFILSQPNSYENQIYQEQWNQIMQIGNMRNAQFSMLMYQQEQMALYLGNAIENSSSKKQSKKKKKKSHK